MCARVRVVAASTASPTFRRLLVVAGIVAVLGLGYLLRGVLLPLFFAFLLAYVLDPFVDRLEALKVPRALGAITVMLGILGGGIGFGLAILLCWLQVNYKLVPLQGNFLIDYYPVKLIPGDFILVGTTILLVVLLASWLPARKAALQPFELKS